MPRKYTPQFSTEERFWSKVNKNGAIPAHMLHLGKCWEWTASCQKHGYGFFKYKNKMVTAHRFSWILTYGETPHDIFVLHKCDNRKCVNPKHLFLGTQQNNMDDMVIKKRDNRSQEQHGEKNNNCKLTSQQVTEIRQRYAKGDIYQRELAIEYNVKQGQISKIILGTRWKSTN